MFKNTAHKERAIALRRKGSSYGEILQEIPVAKSTLSLWLRDVGLSKAHRQRLSEKKRESARRGGQARRKQRESSSEQIILESKIQVGKLSQREKLLIGATLYWAEGSKQKPHDVSAGVIFANSDPKMIAFFLDWLEMLGVGREEIVFELYVHESAKQRVLEIRHFWSKILKSSITMLSRVYFKKNSRVTNRKNIGESYYGLIRVRVSRSTNLNRRISGLVLGICEG